MSALIINLQSGEQCFYPVDLMWMARSACGIFHFMYTLFFTGKVLFEVGFALITLSPGKTFPSVPQRGRVWSDYPRPCSCPSCQTIIVWLFLVALFCHTKPAGAAAKPSRVETAARSSRKAAVQAWPIQSPHQEDLLIHLQKFKNNTFKLFLHIYRSQNMQKI